MLGEAGIGKSALLADLADYGDARGIRVLSAAGSDQESSLPFAGLQQLLRPVLDERPIPPEELRAALGLAPMRTGPDLFRIGTALVELLARQTEGVLVLVDDAHWMDSASLQVLAFAGRRRSAGPITMAYAATGDRPPAALGPGLPELRLGPLSVAEAALLLQVQPHPVAGSIRAQVLAEASGNPQALIELSRAWAGGSAAGAGLGPRPAAGRLSAMFAAQLGQLPSVTRHALLLVAVAGDTDRDVLASVTGGLTPEALAPAEELGLITVYTTGIRFRHPLLRPAVYYDAPFAGRAAIHRQLADVLTGRPDRRAWHLGAAALLPDEGVASLLAASAVQARRRGGPAAMAFILERAADLSPEPADQARRLIYAAEAATSAGHADWARTLADRALEQTPDPLLRLRGQLVTAWALVSSGRYLGATEVLLPLARAAAAGAPSAVWNALGLAATAAYQSGHPDHLRAVAATIAALPPATDDETRASRLWVMTVTGQARAAGVRPRQLGTSERALLYAGAAAWLADQTSHAIRLLRAARNTLDDQQVRAASGDPVAVLGCPLAALGWAYLDAGRWDDALELAAEAGSLAGTGMTSSTATLITATIEAARGDTGHARALVAGGTGLAVSWPGKNPPQTCMYPGEICSSIAGMDSARATALASGNAARISGSPRKWSAWGWVIYTYAGSRSWDFTHAASSRPSCWVMRQSTSRAPPSSLIRVEVDGGQVAGPTASSKPGTALGMGLGSTMNMSKSRLMAPCSPAGRRQGIRNLTAARLRIPGTLATVPASEPVT
jgi:tetratricopeptide (TPR) repeat protein